LYMHCCDLFLFWCEKNHCRSLAKHFEMTKHFSYILCFCATAVQRRSRVFMLLPRFNSLLETCWRFLCDCRNFRCRCYWPIIIIIML
jgi:hypothetical protein